MHIILVQPPIGASAATITPPVGLAYLAAILEQRDVELSCLAADAAHLDVKQTIARINDLKPDAVGLSVTTTAVNNACKIMQGIKEYRPNILGIAGGAHATILPDELLLKGFDIVVRGEGERTIDDLVNFLNGQIKLENIKGISYIKHNTIHHNENRPLLNDLDLLPFPAWHYFPIDSYVSDFKKNDRCLPVITSRGCPGHCIFCYKGIFGNRFRVRSPANIIEEIINLKQRYDIKEFAIIDDNFITITQRSIQVCKLLMSRHIDLPWSLPSGIRADMVTEELLKVLKQSGCYRVGFGVESGNDFILKSIKKNITKDQVRTAVRLAKDLGLEVNCFFMIGNLNETEETINDTIDFAIELDPDIAQFSVAVPLPGSEMYDILKKENRIVSSNWDDYNYFSSKNIIFEHSNLSIALLSKKLSQAYRKFYFRPKFIYRRLKALTNKDELIKTIRAFFKMLKLIKT